LALLADRRRHRDLPRLVERSEHADHVVDVLHRSVASAGAQPVGGKSVQRREVLTELRRDLVVERGVELRDDGV
jgi:hypothetical protein